MKFLLVQGSRVQIVLNFTFHEESRFEPYISVCNLDGRISTFLCKGWVNALWLKWVAVRELTSQSRMFLVTISVSFIFSIMVIFWR